MDLAHLELLMEKTAFPAEAAAFLGEAARRVDRQAGEEFAALTADYLESAAREVAEDKGYGWAAAQVEPAVKALAEKTGLSPYTVWLLLLVEASVPVRARWQAQGVPEQVFWDTFADLRCKLLECQAVQGVWGNFVAHWYPIFYTDRIVKLGRLEFERAAWPREEPASVAGLTLRKGDPVLSIHIPSSGEPFDFPARLDAYRRAWDFFQNSLTDGKLVCVCHSWLLCQGYTPLLGEDSNVRSFQQDFALLGTDWFEEFHDGWRLFGAAAFGPIAGWPEKSSMQRAFKRYFLSGGKPGAGFGVLVYDGERLLTR